LFNDAGFIAGRVVNGSCDSGTEALPGVAGVRVYLEDGRYALTDEQGKYHFEGVAPGAHVVQIDDVTLAPELEFAPCEQPVLSARNPRSQFAQVRAGQLWRADFRLRDRPAPRGEARLGLETVVLDARSLEHQLRFENGAVPVRSARLRLMLPEDLRYVPDSARASDGSSVAEPRIDGAQLTFSLGPVATGETRVLRLRTQASSGRDGELEIRALAQFSTAGQLQGQTAAVSNVLSGGAARYRGQDYRLTPRFATLSAELEATDRKALDEIAAQWRGRRNVKIEAVGHTDSQPIAARNQNRFADNYALSLARAQAVASYLASVLHLEDEAVIARGLGPDEPLDAGKDAAALARNRRVEIRISGDEQVAAEVLTVTTASATSAPAGTVGSWKRTTEDLAALLPSTSRTAAGQLKETVDIESLSTTSGWILPRADVLPAIPSIRIAIAHPPDSTVELRINGALVDALNFDGMERNKAGTLAVSQWRGVDLEEGENQLAARIIGAGGAVNGTLERSIHYGDGAVRAELVREKSRLSADGTSRPVIAVRLFDRFNKPARAGTLGSFRVDAPYRSAWEVDSLHENQLIATGPREPTFEVGTDGMALIELEPTAQSGTALVRLRFNDRLTQELRVWLEPASREWILVGLAAGNAMHQSISKNMTAATVAGEEEGYQQDGRVAFFAKGSVLGKYLLTAAFDSSRDRDELERRLLGVIEPDRYYTIYGDASEQRFEAASREKLYLKLERGRFYAQFGDYETGLGVTELSRYSRTLTGVKVEREGDVLSYQMFATDTDQDYVRDGMQGDGTSGLYRLSRRQIVINSDKVRLEIRDRLRPEQVIERRPLSRFSDYSIDYFNGTLFFRQPVPSRDADFNPVFIVAEYEVQGGRKSVTAGGRAAVKLADDKVEVGASLIHQGAAAGDTDLAGLDLRWRFSDATRLKAEVSRSRSDDPLRAEGASAYLAELQHVTERVDARLYVREQQAGFGVDQQLGVDSGARRAGLDGRLRMGQHFSARGELYQQEVLDTGASRVQATAEVRRESANLKMSAGVRDVRDESPSAPTLISTQGFVGGSLELWQDRIQLRASQDFALRSSDSSSDFPARSLLGIDYRWRPNTTFFADYEHAAGLALNADTTRLGVRTQPWHGAQVQSSIGQQFTENGGRLYNSLGLTQGWTLNERWSLDVGVDQNRTLRGAGLRPLNDRVPLASGSMNDDFLAAFAGALYRTSLWTFTSRLEQRHSDAEQRWIFTGGFYREPKAGHAFSMASQFMDSDARQLDGADTRSSDIRLSWAFRPESSRWMVLNRLDWRTERSGAASGRVDAARIVDNFNSSWQITPGSQLGLQVAARYGRSSFGSESYSGFATLAGFDYRHDLTSWLDVGTHGTVTRSWKSGVGEHAVGIDLGATPVRNVWVAVGYNFKGATDRDFDANRYIAQGVYVNFRIKADQDTFKDLSLGSLRPGRGAAR
jgi:outer membrane protein OmpA-like peptidoglycan-associated protein